MKNYWLLTLEFVVVVRSGISTGVVYRKENRVIDVDPIEHFISMRAVALKKSTIAEVILVNHTRIDPKQYEQLKEAGF